MSTILDALRKVERERDPSSEGTLDTTTVSSEPRRRRSFPTGAIVVCALIGFGGGAILSWWLPSSGTEVQLASLPEPSPPPDIAVPRPPLQAQPVVPAAPVEDRVVASAPPAAVPQPEAPPVAAPPVAALPAPAAPPAAAAPPPPVDASLPPAASVPPKVTAPEGHSAVAALDRKGSAIEPSPFKPSRDSVPAAATEPVAKEPAKKPVDDAPLAPERRELQELAALAPAPAQEPDAAPVDEAALEPEPEPDTSPETLVDTGRSPPGAPKVALSFLQWSTDPSRRFAFISIDGAPSQRIREGEVAAGLTVAAITPTGVQFKREGTLFVIRPRH